MAVFRQFKADQLTGLDLAQRFIRTFHLNQRINISEW
ncbi:Uncharacterised protein [Vibrio cholerae]|nr:Uncharacterised protein [Vibrio cholerae]